MKLRIVDLATGTVSTLLDDAKAAPYTPLCVARDG